jgi:hypothetical protein
MSLLSEPVVVVRAQCKLVYPSMRCSFHLYVLLSIQLVERFYDPLSGDICLDGESISQLNVREYRKHLALVSQEPVSIHHPSVIIYFLRLMSTH